MIYSSLIFPEKIQIHEESLTETFGRFVVEPFERGYGQTVGNALRRVLLSSLEGAAVTAVRVQGVRHEYENLKGLREDVMTFLLNLKKLRVRLFSNGPEMLYLNVKKESEINASMISANPNAKVMNPDLVLGHLEAGGKLDLEMEVSRGRGYIPAEVIRSKSTHPSGFLALDALFSPVVKVYYNVENARVGQVTDYDRLVLEVWTDGILRPQEAVGKAAQLLRESLSLFVPEEERAASAPEGPVLGSASDSLLDPKLRDLLNQPVEIVELSSRASNCLKSSNIRVLKDLVKRKDEELLAMKNFGRKSLDEIKERLKDMGLSLGMEV